MSKPYSVRPTVEKTILPLTPSESESECVCEEAISNVIKGWEALFSTDIVISSVAVCCFSINLVLNHMSIYDYLYYVL